jgi:hypothetical protein
LAKFSAVCDESFLSSRAKRSAVEGSRGDTGRDATGWKTRARPVGLRYGLDFARNDSHFMR